MVIKAWLFTQTSIAAVTKPHNTWESLLHYYHLHVLNLRQVINMLLMPSGMMAWRIKYLWIMQNSTSNPNKLYKNSNTILKIFQIISFRIFHPIVYEYKSLVAKCLSTIACIFLCLSTGNITIRCKTAQSCTIKKHIRICLNIHRSKSWHKKTAPHQWRLLSYFVES